MFLNKKNSKVQSYAFFLKKKNNFFKPKKFGVFFFKRLDYIYAENAFITSKFLNMFQKRRAIIINNKQFLKYVQYIWLKFVNKKIIKFWNYQLYYFFKETVLTLKCKPRFKNSKQLNILYYTKYIQLKNVSNYAGVCNVQKKKNNFFIFKKKKKLILHKKVKNLSYFVFNKNKIFYKTAPNIFISTKTHKLITLQKKKITKFAQISKPNRHLTDLETFIVHKKLPLLYSKSIGTFNNTIGTTVTCILLKHWNVNVFSYLCSLHILKIKFFYIKYKKNIFKALLKLKTMGNTVNRVRLFFKNKQYIKNKKKKIKKYQQFKIKRFFSYVVKNKKNLFVLYYNNTKINKYKRFKLKFKTLKKSLRFVTKLYYLNLFITSKKLKYLRKLFDKYNIFNKTFVLSLAKALPDSTIFMNTKKFIDIINFNKFYLLYAGSLYNYKKFNFFLGTFSFSHNKSNNLLTFKRTALYLRYVILSMRLSKIKNNSINATKPSSSSQKIKKKFNLKLKRKLYLRNLLKFFKLKRFFFFNLTLSFFWKKRSIDYTCAYLLKKYRYFSSYQHKQILKKNHNFASIINIFKQSKKSSSLNLVVSTIFMYKQTSNFFFKYKYYKLLKKQQLLEHCFLYKNNYLSWTFFYFWYWYVFSYISIYFQQASHNLFSTNELVAQTVGNKQMLASQFYLMPALKNNTKSTFENIFISDIRNLFYLKKETLHKNYKVYFNFFFQILLKYILLKNSKLYKRVYALQLIKWKKHFHIFKKVYKNFSSKFAKRSFLSKQKTKFVRKLNLRLKTNIRKLNIKALNFFNTCGYYNYFKRKLFKKKRIYSFFLSFFKKQEKMSKSIQNISLGIADKIGIINVVIYLNNTYVTLTDLYGNVLFVRSGGLVGIKGPNRATSVTSEEVTLAVCSFLKKTSLKFLIIKFSGVLYSRKIKAAFKVFTFQKNYKILRVFNNTPKAHNGIRLKKKKRL